MSPNTIHLVKTSWAAVTPIADQAARLFYQRLFETHPEVRPLFKGDMALQGRRLMAMIDTAVEALDRLDTVAPAIGAMGARHAGYGVQPADYDKVALALLWTLREGLGETFTTEVEAAWTEVYGNLAAVMQAGAAAGDGATA